MSSEELGVGSMLETMLLNFCLLRLTTSILSNYQILSAALKPGWTNTDNWGWVGGRSHQIKEPH